MNRRSSQARVTTRSTKAGSFTHVWERTESGWDAYRYTPWGIVNMYAVRFVGETSFTRLVFIHAGRRYERTFDAFYSSMWAARLATEFAREVVGGRVRP